MMRSSGYIFGLLVGIFMLSAVAIGQTEPQKNRQRIAAVLKDTPAQFIKRFDLNEDGFLTRDELPPLLARLFDRADTNGDGKLDRLEVAGLLRMLRKQFAQGNQPVNNKAQVERVVNDLLRRMDTDGDGKISRQEAKFNVARFFDEIDKNKDGYLDRQELRQMAVRILALRRANAGGAGRGQGATRPNPNRPDFDALDLNADGRLTREELKGTRFFAVFDKIDTDKDGKINRKEFEAYLKKTEK